VSAAFAYYSAPDLALTQLVVEVAMTLLMLLALGRLPSESPRESSGVRKLRDAAVAVFCGAGLGAAAWWMMTRDGPSISAEHILRSVPEGGGANVVNVILVDFRGFDTFGEIIVLGIAGLAIFALLDSALHGDTGRRLRHWVADHPQSEDPHPLMLVVAGRVMLPLAILVGIYIFLRGHNEPGGGFIAGLIVSIALIMQYMASGFAWAHQRQRVDYHALIGYGVIIAGLTGVGAWFAGRPFLTSDYGYVTLPLFGTFELATAMGFDLGVFLTVVGAVMLALANLSRVGQRAEPRPLPDSPMTPDPAQRSSAPQERGS
jgi:multicomponent K+:H+ antiporter subunit A